MAGGYLARTIAEPARISRAVKTAWRRTVEWQPSENWRASVREGIEISISVGGLLGIMMGLLITLSVFADVETGAKSPVSDFIYAIGADRLRVFT